MSNKDLSAALADYISYGDKLDDAKDSVKDLKEQQVRAFDSFMTSCVNSDDDQVRELAKALNYTETEIEKAREESKELTNKRKQAYKQLFIAGRQGKNVSDLVNDIAEIDGDLLDNKGLQKDLRAAMANSRSQLINYVQSLF